MKSRLWSLLVFVVLVACPYSALANAGTPLMWAGMLHLVFGNALIGVFEGLLIGRLFSLPKRKTVLVMISANYFSAWAGGVLGLMTSQDDDRELRDSAGQQLGRVRKQLLMLNDLMAGNNISEASFATRRRKLMERSDQLDREISRLDHTLATVPKLCYLSGINQAQKVSLTTVWSELPSDAKRNAVEHLFDRVIVHRGRVIFITKPTTPADQAPVPS